MNVTEILASIDTELARLQHVRALLVAIEAPAKHRGRPKGSGTKEIVATPKKARRKMSAAGRARIAAAQKARWAKLKAATKEAPQNPAARKTKPKKASAQK
jgi:hypothetical protein